MEKNKQKYLLVNYKIFHNILFVKQREKELFV